MRSRTVCKVANRRLLHLEALEETCSGQQAVSGRRTWSGDGHTSGFYSPSTAKSDEEKQGKEQVRNRALFSHIADHDMVGFKSDCFEVKSENNKAEVAQA